MKKILFLVLIVVLPMISFSQEEKKEVENNIKIKLSGFVKNDFFLDTRETVAAREGHFLLWPSPVVNDAEGNDVNAVTNFNFLSVQSRISLAMSGGNAFGAAVSAKIEGDFFAQANDNINLLRLRHAFVKMNWEKTELLFGQYWNPMFITDCFPGTVSFNTGVPMQPFGRSPQIRLTQTMGVAKFIAVASSQRDYASRGAIGPSYTYMSNSATPEFSAQLHVSPSKTFLAGLGVSFKTITPEIETSTGYATDEKVSSFSGIAFFKQTTESVTFELEGVYGQNIANELSIGGFAVTDITDATKGFQTYSPLTTASFWTDIHTNGKRVQGGIFAGYTKNLGAKEDIVGEIYGLGTNIESIYRVSPRILFNSNNVRFALEGEYTVANYGATKDSKGVPADITAANNFRLLASVYYFFK